MEQQSSDPERWGDEHSDYLCRYALHRVRNKISDYFRKSARETPPEETGGYEKPDTFLVKRSGIPTWTPLPWKFDPRQSFEDVEFWKILEKCTTKFPEQLRQALVLTELEGVSSQETCKVFGVSSKNRRSTSHRSRRKFD